MTSVEDWVTAGSKLTRFIYKNKTSTKNKLKEEEMYDIVRSLSFPSDYLQNKDDFATNLLLLSDYALKQGYKFQSIGSAIKNLIRKDLKFVESNYTESKQAELVQYMDISTN